MHALTKKWLKGLVYAVLFLVILITLIVWGLYWLQTGRYFQSTDDAYITTNSVSVRSQLSARVTSVNVEHNQRVHKGQLLVTLDDRDYRDDLNVQKARLGEARAQVQEAQRRVEATRAQITQYRTQLAGYEARSNQALTTLNRTLMLVSNGVLPKQRLTDDTANSQAAKANVATARAQIVSAEKQLAVQSAAYKAAQASIVAGVAEVTSAETQLGRTRIYAPADGIVGNRTVEPGDYATPQVTLMQLVPVDTFYVSANFKETQISRMRVGQPVSISVDAYPDIDYKGVIDSLSPATGTEFSLLPMDNATGNFNKIVQRIPVRIRFTGPRDQLWRLQSGLSVEPEVDTRGDKGDQLYAESPIIEPKPIDLHSDAPQPSDNLPQASSREH
ncbi:Colistin resistance protein EmrA [Halomonadaceae bacterium LMG 33818]|uniref:efflux RND transporter periplasmic adaptor subunit n=1 Tax=Cernens ardua TaxID=3402176 RepID=UPI003EDC1180